MLKSYLMQKKLIFYKNLNSLTELLIYCMNFFINLTKYTSNIIKL